MGGGKRKNPRSVPKTKADVDRAYEQGVHDGMMMFLNIALLTFNDIGCEDEFLERFNKKFNSNLESHVKRFINERDIQETLKSEKGWEIGLI